MLEALLWKRLQRGWQRSRLDAAMLARSLTGRHPSPLIPQATGRRSRSARARSRAARSGTLVEIVDVVRETSQAVSLWLERVDGKSWSFVPGQFLTMVAPVQGEVLRRAYSISSSPAETARVRITCKRVPGGRMSTFLNERVQPGDRLRVFGPSGSFTVRPSPSEARHLVMLGGGSGITPLMGIAHAVLEGEPLSHVSLVYGNRSAADVIFAAELERMTERHGQRLHVRHVLEEPASTGAHHRIGKLDRTNVAAELEAVLSAVTLPARFYLCGPSPMMVAAREALTAAGVPAGSVLEERFSSPMVGSGKLGSSEPQRVTLLLADGARSFRVLPGQTVLEAALSADVPVRFSCSLGGCGACKAKLREGRTDLERPNCLTAAEEADSAILPCVAHPLSDLTVEALT